MQANYPVCLAAQLPASRIDQFLDEAFAGFNTLVGDDDSERCLALVTAKDGSPNVPSQATVPPVSDTLSSPFIGQTPEQIGRQVVKDEYHCFIVLDERSARDKSAVAGILVEGAISTVRVEFQSAQLLVSNLAVANTDHAEAQSLAGNNGGIYKLDIAPADVEETPRKELRAM